MKEKGKKAYEQVWAKHLAATTEEEKAEAVKFQKEVQALLTAEELEQYNAAALADIAADEATLHGIIQDAKEERMRERLGDITKIVSLGYIAQTYFGKSRAWLYQRINANKVNGKSARFTDSEAQQLQDALHDLGHKLSSVAIV